MQIIFWFVEFWFKAVWAIALLFWKALAGGSVAKRSGKRSADKFFGNGRFTNTYQTFIKSPEWRAKRAKVIKRDGGKCVQCGARSHLQVDHKVYPARTAGFQAFVRQPNSQLQTLCVSCHKRVTQQRRSKR